MQKPSVTRKELLGWTQSSLRSFGTSLGHVGNNLANGLSALTTDSSDKERITIVKFGELEYTPSKRNGIKTVRRTVLLVGYVTGFQLWDLDSGAPNLLVSRREGPVRCGQQLPLPRKTCLEAPPLLSWLGCVIRGFTGSPCAVELCQCLALICLTVLMSVAMASESQMPCTSTQHVLCLKIFWPL